MPLDIAIVLHWDGEDEPMPYKTQNGRRIALPRSATNGIQHCVAVSGTVAIYECAAGHRMAHDYGKGPISRRMPEAAVAKHARYCGLGVDTNGRRGHCYGWCQRCQNIADGIAKEGVFQHGHPNV